MSRADSHRAFVCALFAAVFTLNGCVAAAAGIGFQQLHIANGSEPPLAIGIWYPTRAGATIAGHGLALVVLSHGGGGSYESHYDTALALARAGFVAAAVSHTGDTYDDQSQVLRLWRRPAQLRRLVSYMLDEWPEHGRLDGARVGAFGFSNGGFTVLVAAGGVPQLGKTAAYCQAHPDHDLCRALQEGGADPGLLGADAPPGSWRADPRIKAVVIAAPAYGFAFDRAGLKNVHIPVQLWRAAKDHHQPNPFYDEAVRVALPRPPEYHVIADANHYAFLPPCNAHLARMAPRICIDPRGFDRAAFHQAFNAQIVRFLRDTLR
ncbi:MAG TPA: hypothetical protein VIY54_09520 [Steroidobacteraceae bacterium]